MLHAHPYNEFLPAVEKPARYIGGEKYSLIKDWSKVDVSIALCFPDIYEVGMSHLGLKILYDELNREQQIVAERCFCPWPDAEKELTKRKLPLVSLESRRKLSEFDVLGFSLQYELSFTSVLTMLHLGGVDFESNARGESSPIVIAGGPACFNPLPVEKFFDAFVIGDGESLTIQLLQEVSKAKKEGLSRGKTLSIISALPGVYVPSISKRVKRHIRPDLESSPFPTTSPIPHLTTVFDRFAVELSRGCTEGCRFCQAGIVYRPVRERKPLEVIETVLNGLDAGGFDEASLTCLSTADYSAVTPLVIQLIDKLSERNAGLGISSLRAYGLDEEVLNRMALLRKSSLTFAPEAGSERLRRVINKNVTNEDLRRTAENVFSRGWKKMKLYFMIGLPTETDEDVLEIITTAKEARDVAKRVGVKYPDITVSVSNFVPKPHTPFQWAEMISPTEIQRKQALLRDLAKQERFTLKTHNAEASLLEGVFSRGDRDLAKVIVSAWESGARLDGWSEHLDLDLWKGAFHRSGIEPLSYLSAREETSELPWSFVETGVSDDFLHREWKRALKEAQTAPCGKVAQPGQETYQRELQCYHCGIKCDLGSLEQAQRSNQESAKKTNGHSTYLGTKAAANKAPVVYRIMFQKLGLISFISHLDLQKVIQRIFQRAKIETVWSKGFHPSPGVLMGPALALGFSSFEEYFDVRVAEAWSDPDKIIKRLQENAETGINFCSARKLGPKDRSIQQSLATIDYFALFDDSRGLQDLADLLGQSKELWVEERSAKAKVNKRDVRPFVGRVSIDSLVPNETSRSLLIEAGVIQDKPVRELNGLRLQAMFIQGRTARPREICQAIEDNALQPTKLLKIATNLRDLSY